MCKCKDAQGMPIKLEEHINDWATTDRRAYTATMCRELLDVSVFLRGGAPLSAGLSRGVDSGSVSRDPLVVRDSSANETWVVIIETFPAEQTLAHRTLILALYFLSWFRVH